MPRPNHTHCAECGLPILGCEACAEGAPLIGPAEHPPVCLDCVLGPPQDEEETT